MADISIVIGQTKKKSYPPKNYILIFWIIFPVFL